MKVLQISCSYFPDKIGGTEVYVHDLSKELTLRGHQVFISFVGDFCEKDGPRVRSKEYIYDGIPVFKIEKNYFGLKTAELYFDPGEKIYTVFKDYLQEIQPQIVHFHHFSPHDVLTQMKLAKEIGISIILTYHTPMMTCGHQDMLYLGRNVCGGRIDYRKCLVCIQMERGVPFLIAFLWANLPKRLARTLGIFIYKSHLAGRLATWLQLPWLMQERIGKWQEGLNLTDHFVAVCQWVKELLINNSIPPGKITLCRQGIGQEMPKTTKKKENSTLRLGYFGRIHPLKGIHVLLRAFRLIPAHYQLELHIYGIPEEDRPCRRYYAHLLKQTRKDKRIKWQGVLSERDKYQVMSELDILVIPSLWLETGPLVLLEAWASGTPVIGTRLGGIAELVSDGVGGLLFEPAHPKDLAKVIMRVCNEPDLLAKLRASIPKVCTMKEVATEMEELYNRLISRGG